MIKIKLIITFTIICTMSFAQDNGLLWEISKEGYNTSYVFGTIHLNHNLVLPKDSLVLSTLFECEAYAGEIILNEQDMLTMMQYVFEKDTSKQCAYVFSEAEMQEINHVVAEKKGHMMALLAPKMSPYMLATILSIPNELTEGDSYMFLDMYLQLKADSIGLNLISLETIESQMAYIQQISINEQKRHLINIVENIDDKQEDVSDLIKIYKDEDLNKILRLITENEDNDPLLKEDFIIERNHIHANGIINAMKTQSTFTGIGAAHLPGENGILNLLRNEGFTLKNISF